MTSRYVRARGKHSCKHLTLVEKKQKESTGRGEEKGENNFREPRGGECFKEEKVTIRGIGEVRECRLN